MPDPAPLTAAEIAELAAKVEKMTPGAWTIGEVDHAATVRAAPCMEGGEPEPPEDVAIPFGRAYSDARGIVALRNAAPRLIATIEGQAKRIAELEAGLLNACNTLEARNDAAQRRFIATLGYALLNPTAPKEG